MASTRSAGNSLTQPRGRIRWRTCPAAHAHHCSGHPAGTPANSLDQSDQGLDGHYASS
jgi:hypothetical protein